MEYPIAWTYACWNLGLEFINMYLVTYTDSSTLNVPLDTGNRHYQEILEWVAAGNTITDSGE